MFSGSNPLGDQILYFLPCLMTNPSGSQGPGQRPRGGKWNYTSSKRPGGTWLQAPGLMDQRCSFITHCVLPTTGNHCEQLAFGSALLWTGMTQFIKWRDPQVIGQHGIVSPREGRICI